MHNRRDFLKTAGGVALAAIAAPRLLAEQFSPDIAALYRKSVVVDTLCGPFTSADAMPDAALVEVVKQSGITAINFTISERTFEDTISNLAYVDALVEQFPAVFTMVRLQSDIARAKREGKIGIMPGFQYTQFLEEDPSRIETFRRLGVRIMQLTYNNRSIFGDGCLEPGNAGLSKAGLAAVAKMNELGVAVDLSHSGYRTTSEAIAASKKPVLISHSGCASIYAHPRNKPDDVMKALADKRRILWSVSDAVPGGLADGANSGPRHQPCAGRTEYLRKRPCRDWVGWVDPGGEADSGTAEGI